MRRKADPNLLREIATIRGLQRVAAKAEAARAASTLRKKNEIRTESERQRQLAEESWLASLSTPPLRMELSRLWSADLLRQEQTVRHTTIDTEDAAAELQRRATSWHLAAKRCDIANDMARKAMNDRIQEREEIALQDASDLHLQRRSGR